MIEGPRPVKPSEYGSLLKLVNRTFIGTEKGRGMESLYPWHLGKDNRQNLWVMVEAGRVVSHVGVNKRAVSIHGARIPIVLVSSVCTDPEYRGQGLASKLMEHLKGIHDRQGFDLYFISGNRDLYRRMGAAPVGRKLHYVLNPRALDPFAHPDVTVRPADQGDLKAISALYAREPVRIIRPGSDFRRVFRAGWAGLAPARFFVAEVDDVITAYFVVAVARKAGGPTAGSRLLVIEHAGSRTDLLAALDRACTIWNKRRVEISVSPHDRESHALLGGRRLGEQAVPVYDSLAIINLDRLIGHLKPVLLKRAGAPARKLEGGERNLRFSLTLGPQSLETSRDAMLKLLFGEPHRDRPAGLRAEGLLGRVLRTALPLPMASPGISYV